MSRRSSILLVVQQPRLRQRVIRALESLGWVVRCEEVRPPAPAKASLQPAHAVVAVSAASASPASAELAAKTGISVSPSADEPDAPPEIILTDQPVVAAAYPPAAKWLAEGHSGVIVVGATGSADVSLPRDVTDRELRLACRLLGEIVRLRRRDAQGRAERAKLREMAITDPLTGLANRRGWDLQLARMATSLDGKTTRPCLALFDLDLFKQVNQEHGHRVGDDVLRAVARILSARTRRGDTLARLGGDEFGLLVDIEPDKAEELVEWIRQGVGQQLPDWNLPAVTASAGVCIPQSAEAARMELLAASADWALLQAKQQGRNRTIVNRDDLPFSPGPQARSGGE